MRDFMDRYHHDVQKFLDEHVTPDMTDEDINDLLQKFNVLYNAGGYHTEEDAFDYVERMKQHIQAGDIRRAEAAARKALQIDPDCIDAITFMNTHNIRSEDDYIAGLKKSIDQATAIMKKQGYLPDEIGNFWRIWETRPYMRLLSDYADFLTFHSRPEEAVPVYESLLKLNPGDNQGIRYVLFGTYVRLNVPEKKLLKIMDDYDDDPSSYFLLPLTFYYYRKGDLEKAEETLRDLAEANSDTQEFFKAVALGRINQYKNKLTMGYRPYTIDELVLAYDYNSTMFKNQSGFFSWCKKTLKKIQSEAE